MKSLKSAVIVLLFMGMYSISFAQKANTKLYSPEKDATKQIESAVKMAKEQNKHVLLQVGGNWCSWCIMLHKFYASDAQVDSMLKADYIVEYVNFSKENKNLDVLKTLNFPQRFGFPVLVILDGNGNRLHTQNSVFLEKDRGYDKKIVVGFLRNWSPGALDPKQYTK